MGQQSYQGLKNYKDVFYVSQLQYIMIDIKHRSSLVMVLFRFFERRNVLIPRYMTINEACEKWRLGNRWINNMCNSGKIPGAQKFGTMWAISSDMEKPAHDSRVKDGKYRGWRKKYGNKRKQELYNNEGGIDNES